MIHVATSILFAAGYIWFIMYPCRWLGTWLARMDLPNVKDRCYCLGFYLFGTCKHICPTKSNS